MSNKYIYDQIHPYQRRRFHGGPVINLPPFQPPDNRCQLCGSADVVAHVWKCECGAVGNGEMHVHKEEKAIQ